MKKSVKIAISILSFGMLTSFTALAQAPAQVSPALAPVNALSETSSDAEIKAAIESAIKSNPSEAFAKRVIRLAVEKIAPKGTADLNAAAARVAIAMNAIVESGSYRLSQVSLFEEIAVEVNNDLQSRVKEFRVETAVTDPTSTVEPGTISDPIVSSVISTNEGVEEPITPPSTTPI